MDPTQKMHVMLDLETIGNSANSAVIAIGAVAFNIVHGINPLSIQHNFYAQISLASCVDHGLVMDASTVLWWLQQSEAARGAFKDNAKALYLDVALDLFTEWFNALPGTNKEKFVWGNGSDFDNVILANAYRACKKDIPWRYSNNRCFRTLREGSPEILQPENMGTAHNALDDARFQATWALAILRGKQYGSNPTGQLKSLT